VNFSPTIEFLLKISIGSLTKKATVFVSVAFILLFKK